jgi:hypothetical protein
MPLSAENPPADTVSDIFISYSKSDRAKAQMLAKALEREGWSVWWDPKIPPGKTFDEVIEQALDAAKCVVVLWSKKSASSDWVKTEAAAGKRRGILIPALIEDDVKLPFEFSRLHASRLADWQGEQQGHLEFEEVKNAVAQLLGGTTSVAAGTPNFSVSGVPVAATTERTPSNEKVSEQVQAKRPQSQGKKNVREISFGGKILPAWAVPFVLAWLVAALVVAYVWINRLKPPVSKLESPRNPEVHLDSTTGLIWTKSDNGHNVTWSQANGYCQNLRLGGYSDWRLPTLEELEKLYDPKAGDGSQIRGPFKLTGWHVWSSTKRDSYSVWGFGFAFGGRLVSVLNASDNMRALCVRGPGE